MLKLIPFFIFPRQGFCEFYTLRERLFLISDTSTFLNNSSASVVRESRKSETQKMESIKLKMKKLSEVENENFII